jgi:hypothetical protein
MVFKQFLADAACKRCPVKATLKEVRDIVNEIQEDYLFQHFGSDGKIKWVIWDGEGLLNRFKALLDPVDDRKTSFQPVKRAIDAHLTGKKNAPKKWHKRWGVLRKRMVDNVGVAGPYEEVLEWMAELEKTPPPNAPEKEYKWRGKDSHKLVPKRRKTPPPKGGDDEATLAEHEEFKRDFFSTHDEPELGDDADE